MELSWSIDCPDGVLIDYLFFLILLFAVVITLSYVLFIWHDVEP